MSEFIRPQVHVEEISDTAARVSVEPLERGYGDTLGNSLRRVLLSSLEGAAVEAIQIDGAQHEFTTIPNMVEDVTDIVLNVKGLVFRTLGTTDEGTATISVDGPCEVTGADFFIPSEFELVNPDQHIATLTEGGHLTMSMRIGYGRGYVSYEQNKRDNDPIGIIHVDSSRRSSAAPSSSRPAALVSTPTTIVWSSRSRPMARFPRVTPSSPLPTSSTSTWLRS